MFPQNDKTYPPHTITWPLINVPTLPLLAEGKEAGLKQTARGSSRSITSTCWDSSVGSPFTIINLENGAENSTKVISKLTHPKMIEKSLLIGLYLTILCERSIAKNGH